MTVPKHRQKQAASEFASKKPFHPKSRYPSTSIPISPRFSIPIIPSSPIRWNSKRHGRIAPLEAPHLRGQGIAHRQKRCHMMGAVDEAHGLLELHSKAVGHLPWGNILWIQYLGYVYIYIYTYICICIHSIIYRYTYGMDADADRV